MRLELDPDAGSVVRGHADATFGRVVLSARQNHFVSDGRVSNGAPGEAIFAGELLLASLVSCGLGLVHLRAKDTDNKEPAVELIADFVRDTDDPTRFKSLTLNFWFEDLSRQLAEDYVGYFTSKCPIYNTLKRGGELEVNIACG